MSKGKNIAIPHFFQKELNKSQVERESSGWGNVILKMLLFKLTLPLILLPSEKKKKLKNNIGCILGNF